MTPAQLIQTATRHQVLLEGLKTGEVNDFLGTFGKIDKTVRDILNELQVNRLDELSRGKLETVLSTLEAAQTEVFELATEKFLDKMPGIAAMEARFNAAAIQSVLTPEGRPRIKTPPAEKAAAEALKRPVQATGDLLKPLVENWARGAITKTNNAVRNGYETGKTVPQIVKDLQGTQALRFQDGVTAVNKRHAATVVRTAVQHVASTARDVTYEQNSDVVKGVEWVSTLDGKTTTQCRSLDGKKFKLNEGPRPPIHPNCRSCTAPDLDEAFDFLDKGATRSSAQGYVDANLTYYDWLKQQDAEFQDAVLGPTRGTLLRDGGLTTKRFAELQLDKTWQPLTLAQMKELEPLAFARAGLTHDFPLPPPEPAPKPVRPSTRPPVPAPTAIPATVPQKKPDPTPSAPGSTPPTANRDPVGHLATPFQPGDFAKVELRTGSYEAHLAGADHTLRDEANRITLAGVTEEGFHQAFGMNVIDVKKHFLKDLPLDDETLRTLEFSIRKSRDVNSYTLAISTVGNKFQNIRYIDFSDMAVEHSLFSLSKELQGSGIAKVLGSNQLAFYDHLGIKKIDVHANVDVGGYAWVRYGFVPSRKSWDELYNGFKQALRHTPSGVSPEQSSRFAQILEDGKTDPKTVRKIAALKEEVIHYGKKTTLGKVFLLGTDWEGALNLNKAEDYAIYSSYLRGK